MQHSYTFPHKSRAAIIDWLLGLSSRSYHYQTYRFAFCVKAYVDFDGDSLRKQFPDLDPSEDAAWDAWLDDNDWFFWSMCEDAGRHVSEGDWTSYPGYDQGDWEWKFNGRAGGWLTLVKWRGYDMRNPDREELEEMDWDDLRAFYRGIRTAIVDFTTDKATAEVEYHAAGWRDQWEDERAAERDRLAEQTADAMMYARPDLYEVAHA